MKHLLFLSIVISSIFQYAFLPAQITGLWEITGVTVGDQSKTPIAKWTHIHEDGTYESGNGWLQNSKGTYTYDPATGTYEADDSLGFDDPYGSFSVEINDDEMTWQRMEDGMEVTVSLQRIKQKPMAPADKICGAWDLAEAKLGERDIIEDMDPNDEIRTLMRWDRVFINIEPDGSQATGYWIFNAHRPELTLIHHDKKMDDGSWIVSFEENKMVWTENSDRSEKMKMTFLRIYRFPK